MEVEGAGGKTERLNAARGVILASGDFSSDPALKSRFAPRIADVEGINPTSTGDGQSMAEAVGAEIVNGEVMTGPQIRFVAPPRKRLIELIPPARPFALAMRHSLKWLPSWLLRPFFMMFVTTNLAPSPLLFAEGAVLVNNRGERFTDETKEPQFAIPRQPDRIAHIVFDHQVASRFTGWPHYISTAPGVAYAYLKDYKRNRKDIYHEADSLEGLAAKLGVPAQALMRSIDAYNASRPAGKPAIVKAPFYALGPAKSWIIHTEGGVRINTRMEVLDRSGTPIPGLFAAGSAGQSGVMLEGHGHHLGWAFTSGRLAGRSAVQPRSPASVTKVDDALLVKA